MSSAQYEQSATPRKGVSAIVLAGGKGTRLASVYSDRPKPMVPAGGHPFLYWVTGWLAAQGVTRIIYSVCHMGHQIETWASELNGHGGMELSCVRETEPLGTGGGAINCLGEAGDAVLILNGDSLMLTDLAPAFEFLETGFDGAIMATEVEDTGRYGSITLGDDGRMLSFSEKRPGRGLINAGIYLLRKEALEDFPKGASLSMETDIIPRMLKSGARIGVVKAGGPFLDIGLPETVTLADDFVTENAGAFRKLA